LDEHDIAVQYGHRGPLPHPGETGLVSFGRAMGQEAERRLEWCREQLRKHGREPRLSVAFPAGTDLRCPAPTPRGVCGAWLGRLKSETRAIVRILGGRTLPPISYPGEEVKCPDCPARLEKFLTYATDSPYRV
jgi:hypothetical protein